MQCKRNRGSGKEVSENLRKRMGLTYHARVGGSLLGLKVDCVSLATLWTFLDRPWELLRIIISQHVDKNMV
jgi:hypothetical protein